MGPHGPEVAECWQSAARGRFHDHACVVGHVPEVFALLCHRLPVPGEQIALRLRFRVASAAGVRADARDVPAVMDAAEEVERVARGFLRRVSGFHALLDHVEKESFLQ